MLCCADWKGSNVVGDVRKLRIGIIGGGFMAAVHSRAATAAGAELAMITSSTPLKGEAAAEALGFGSAASDGLALIADPSIDVVHICTPNATHQPLASAAILAGKHVICEKPLATDGALAAALAAGAAKRGVIATVPFVYRFHPMVREARARISAGGIGAVSTVIGHYLQDWLLASGDNNWRVNSSSGGRSRAFADIGSHLVDLIEFVTGDYIQCLCAITSTVHPRRSGQAVTTEDLAAVLFRLAGGATGTLLVSQVAAGHKNDLRLEIFGTEASIQFSQEQPEILQIGRRDGTEMLVRDSAVLGLDAARLSIVPPGHPMGYQDAFNGFVRDTYQAIQGSKPDGLPTFNDGARANQITDAVLDSAHHQRWVDVAPAAPARSAIRLHPELLKEEKYA